MSQAPTGETRDLGYRRTRLLILGAGLGVLLLIAAVMYARRVETVEVWATLLFIPIFIGLVFWKLKGGLIAAALAAVAYALLRYPAAEAVGADRFTGLILSRGVAFLAFGAIGGWANRVLEMSLTKLELYDQIDDATGLNNARFFVQDTDLEMSRSKRYQTLFSVSVIDVPASALDRLTRRQKAAALRDLGAMLADSVRTVDRAAHARGDNEHRFAVVLPETGPEGAQIFTDRFADRVADYLTRRGAELQPSDVGRTALTFPGDDARLEEVRRQFAAIDRAEHPEAASTT